VVSAEAAVQRAEASVTKAQQRASEAIETHRCPWPAQRFATPEAATAALAPLAKPWTYPQVSHPTLVAPTHDACKGRPTPSTPIQAIDWQIQAQVQPQEEPIEPLKQAKAGCGLGTTLEANQLSDAEVIRAYTGQAQAEGGLRFRKEPLFFVSSLLVNTPSRLQGLRMVMTWALLVYSVTQRRLRQQ
jgi:hypothetical protein